MSDDNNSILPGVTKAPPAEPKETAGFEVRPPKVPIIDSPLGSNTSEDDETMQSEDSGNSGAQ